MIRAPRFVPHVEPPPPPLTVAVTPYSIAERFIGLKELPGAGSNPFVLGMLRLDATWPEDDSVPWCSAFVNFPFWLLHLPRTKSLRARSWLTIGRPVALKDAEVGFDVVVLKRGSGDQPGPEVIEAPGHVGFFSGFDEATDRVHVLGGNQGDAVTVASYPIAKLLGIRRVA